MTEQAGHGGRELGTRRETGEAGPDHDDELAHDPAIERGASNATLRAIQRRLSGGRVTEGVHAAAARGTSTPATALPYAAEIQAAFGRLGDPGSTRGAVNDATFAGSIVTCMIPCVLAACASVPAPSPPNVVSNRDRRPPTADELAREAERLLDAATPVDYRRPTVHVPVDYRQATALFVAACRRGERRSCWMAYERVPFEAPEREEVEHHMQRACLAGHALSCRALFVEDSDTPGWCGRVVGTAPAACDAAALRRECAADFPASCDKLSDLDVPDADAAWLRTLALLRDGCRAGLTSECDELQRAVTMYGGSPEDRALANGMLCRLDAAHCTSAAIWTDDATSRRDFLERGCQYASHNVVPCYKLAEGYTRGTFVEPVPGRGTALQAWDDARMPKRP